MCKNCAKGYKCNYHQLPDGTRRGSTGGGVIGRRESGKRLNARKKKGVV